MKTLKERLIEVNEEINKRWNEYIEVHPVENVTDLRIGFLKDPLYQVLADKKIQILKQIQRENRNYLSLIESKSALLNHQGTDIKCVYMKYKNQPVELKTTGGNPFVTIHIEDSGKIYFDIEKEDFCNLTEETFNKLLDAEIEVRYAEMEEEMEYI